MAKMSYSELNTQTLNQDGTQNYKVEFFSIKPNEEAIVRFFINSIDDFDIETVHPITVGQASFPNRRVSCLRNASDPLNVCPLCAAGEKVQQRIYIKMIQYVSENGRIVPKAVIWDRPAYSYAPQLKSYLDNYGPLTNIVCKITRRGEGLDTKYDIIPNLNPQMYNEQYYPKMFTDFDGYEVLGGVVMDKTADEITEFIKTGNFPQKPTTNSPTTNSPTNIVTPQFTTDLPPVGVDEEVPFATSTPQPQMGRPVRYY